MGRPKNPPVEFDHLRPETWTWDSLNAWLRSDPDEGALRAAMRAEQRRGLDRRQSYYARIVLKLSRLLYARVRAELLGMAKDARERRSRR